MIYIICLALCSTVTIGAPYQPNIAINVAEFKKAIFNASENTPNIIYLDNSQFLMVQVAVYADKNRPKLFPDESNLIFAKGYFHEKGHYTYIQYAFDCQARVVQTASMYFDNKGKLLKISPSSSSFESEIFKSACKNQ